MKFSGKITKSTRHRIVGDNTQTYFLREEGGAIRTAKKSVALGFREPGPRLGCVVGHVTCGAPGVALFGKPIGPAAHVGLMDVVFQLLQAELLEALITAVAICQCVG